MRVPPVVVIMSNRNHHVSFAVGFVVLCLVSLLFLLNKTHEQLQEAKAMLEILDDKYVSLKKQFESLFEYKERLYKSLMEVKEEKSLLFDDNSVKSELVFLKEKHQLDLQRLQGELDSCRRREEVHFIEGGTRSKSSSTQGQESPSVPFLPPVVAAVKPNPVLKPPNKPLKLPQDGNGDPRDMSLGLSHADVPKRSRTNNSKEDIKVITSLSLNPVQNHNQLLVNKERVDPKEPIQSPIGHVPAQPSGDPNEDLAGNIFV